VNGKIVLSGRPPFSPAQLEHIHLDRCASTNDYLKSHALEFRDRFPVLVTAGQQTGGKGRDQRSWVSSYGKGLYASFGFQLDSATKLFLLPLVAGISVIETLKDLSGLQFDLKWPNDVLYRRKKIAGILIENTITDDTLFCITGIGINLNYTEGDFPAQLRDQATSVKIACQLPRDLSPGEVAPMLSDSFCHWLWQVHQPGGQDVIETANRYSSQLIDHQISFHQPPGNQKISGIFKGINHDGGLILKRQDGSTSIYHSGEIHSFELPVR
jgi:BirA family biotin operon repressor/biotin-[acetyl-CoA-carboxylase] ligase